MNDLRTFVPLDPARIKRIGRELVLFRRRPTELRIGSLHVPETSRYVDRADLADIIAIGSDVTDVKAGDVILLPDLMEARGKFTHGGETYTFIDKAQLQGVAAVES